MQTTKTTFQILLSEFNQLVDDMPPAKSIKEKLIAISEKAKISPELNYRQRDAITDRVKFYLDGSYGRNKKKQEYSANN